MASDLGVDVIAAGIGGRGVERADHVRLEGLVLGAPERHGVGLPQHVGARPELGVDGHRGVLHRLRDPGGRHQRIELDVADHASVARRGGERVGFERLVVERLGFGLGLGGDAIGIGRLGLGRLGVAAGQRTGEQEGREREVEVGAQHGGS